MLRESCMIGGASACPHRCMAVMSVAARRKSSRRSRIPKTYFQTGGLAARPVKYAFLKASSLVNWMICSAMW